MLLYVRALAIEAVVEAIVLHLHRTFPLLPQPHAAAWTVCAPAETAPPIYLVFSISLTVHSTFTMQVWNVMRELIIQV